MQTLADLLNTIPAIDPAAMSRAQRHIDGLLKPVGSLGRLEALAIQLAGMPGLNGIPHVGKKAVLVMCADHGRLGGRGRYFPKRSDSHSG
ncbi:Nicotinate-nucleotide--dimethylbenzimidazole phosphoribosyltransferase [Escherichia coli]|uniref:Nicotinate-nucleotide--dimethylbenzimidazole phosphoribosyltransferase n=1 Tax=Escherichia coli TaxID=562 RepID=A0A2X1KEW6_ECOLX|nr:Nicotinate-nucleotide--dimethylbenzimidazole phosphoribosyltransferase [Escherichia coli]